MDNLKTYTFKARLGIDDLKQIYAFTGNSQGDTSATNSLEEYYAAKGWLSFGFNCNLDQESINKESEERIIYNNKYILELKESGKFGEEYDINITLKCLPLFDENEIVFDKSSYKVTFLNFSNETR